MEKRFKVKTFSSTKCNGYGLSLPFKKCCKFEFIKFLSACNSTN